jgi:hypothetical protein
MQVWKEATMSARSRGISLVPVLLTLLALLGGCERKKPYRGGGDEDEAIFPEHVGAPLTDEESQEFAARFEKAVNSGDDVEVNNLIDMAALFERSLRDLGMSEEDRRAFQKRAGYAPKQGGGFGQRITREIAEGTSYTFLRTHTIQDEVRALFRLIASDGSVDYQDLVLARRPDGQIKCLDVHQFRLGEPFSRTIHRQVIPQLVEDDPKLKERLHGAARAFVDHQAEVQGIERSLSRGEPRDALKLCDKLPASLQEEKSILLMRLRATQRRGGEPYRQAFDKLRARYPNDTGLDLHAIDYHLLRKEHVRALEMVARLDTALGGDPYLNVVRARVHGDAGDGAAERRAGLKAIKDDPALEPAYWVLVDASLREKNFDDTLKWLREIEKKFSPRLVDFSTVPDYADFVKSPQYQEWLKSHPVRKP